MDYNWESLIIEDHALTRLKSICESLRASAALQQQGIELPCSVLLYGAPGTGKTQIVRTLASEVNRPFIAASAADLKTMYIGRKWRPVRDLFEKARAMAPSMVFIDELDSCAPARGSQYADPVSDEIVTQLRVAMEPVPNPDQRHVFVVAATNYLERIDPAILARFAHHIEIPFPGTEQRRQLFKLFLGRQARLDFDVEEMADELSRKAGYISGRDINRIVSAASKTALERACSANNPEQFVLTREDVLSQLSWREVTGEELVRIWSNVIVEPDSKASILQIVQWFNSGHPAMPRGLLLYGPPGTGKTEIVRRIAESINGALLSLSPVDLFGGFVGQTRRKVQETLHKVRSMRRGVVFIDECDFVFPRRSAPDSDQFGRDERVDEFLVQWDQWSSGQILVVGETSRRERMDEAILSRFAWQIETGLPNCSERLQILRLKLRDLEYQGEIPEFVRNATTGYTGRDLTNVLHELQQLSVAGQSITLEIWKQVIERYQVSNWADENAQLGIPDSQC